MRSGQWSEPPLGRRNRPSRVTAPIAGLPRTRLPPMLALTHSCDSTGGAARGRSTGVLVTGGCGAPGRTRTADAHLRTVPLCPLSYGGSRPIVPARLQSGPHVPLHRDPGPDRGLLHAPGLPSVRRRAADAPGGSWRSGPSSGRRPCRVQERDLTDDPAWERRYLERIPVLAVDDDELSLATERPGHPGLPGAHARRAARVSPARSHSPCS